VNLEQSVQQGLANCFSYSIASLDPSVGVRKAFEGFFFRLSIYLGLCLFSFWMKSSRWIEDIKHDEGFVSDAYIAVWHVGGDAVEVAFSCDSFFIANFQDCFPAVDHADLFVRIRMDWNAVVGQRSAQNHHHLLSVQTSQNRGF